MIKDTSERSRSHLCGRFPMKQRHLKTRHSIGPFNYLLTADQIDWTCWSALNLGIPKHPPDFPYRQTKIHTTAQIKEVHGRKCRLYIRHLIDYKIICHFHVILISYCFQIKLKPINTPVRPRSSTMAGRQVELGALY